MPKLSDKLGVMNIVDTLNAKQLLVEEYLNLPQLKEKISESVADYYQKQGVVVDNSTIEEATNQYFADRLRYKQVKYSFLQEKIIKTGFYVNEKANIIKKSLAAFVFAILSFFGLNVYQDNNLQNQFDSQIQKQATFVKALPQIKNSLNNFQNLKLNNVENLKNEIINQAFLDLEKLQNLTSQNNDIALDVLNQRLANEGSLIANLNQNINNLENLQRKDLQINDLKTKFNAMNLNATDKNQITSEFISLQTANYQDLTNKINSLENLAKFASNEYKMVIVNRPGESTALERNFNKSGGKAWYVIVEVIDSNNKPFAINIKDSESSQTRLASKFGVRISQNQYEALRRDKMDDGLISNPIIANKQKNSLQFTYLMQVQNDRILTID